ncbi:HNH endonuclease family protein [Gordonia sp. CPCC 206044]|uniref:HNH endonuclease family protein n=1 Tax=Gordonia sp. CPCC 206044 TaxID=3140793 RepID=UPI003AF392AF
MRQLESIATIVGSWRRSGYRGVEWPLRWWLIAAVCVGSAVLVAIGTALPDDVPSDPAVARRAQIAVSELSVIDIAARRPARDDYQREAFGAAWTDDVRVVDGANGCDTRNDVLARDLRDTRRAPVRSCPTAVMSGEFRSPYTGEFLVFRRDGHAGAVQIDHIVPLAYAWDMGAWAWAPGRRADFANDPANLVAVDASSNLTKSDHEPARWMPPDDGFHCQYAIEFVMVSGTYGLALDRRSRDVLLGALRSC